MPAGGDGRPSCRSYQQYCPMASALDVIGDRWALLVVRELMLGPQRFSEIAAGLAGISTDILTTRLRGLTGAGVVTRAGTGRQQRYLLTDRGRALRPVLTELGRWGAALLDPPTGPEQLSARTGLTTLVLDPPAAPAGLAGVFDIRCDGQTARVAAGDGRIALVPLDDDPVEPATAVIELSRAGLLSVIAGTDPPSAQDLVIRGDRDAGALLVRTLSAPQVLAALTARARRAPRRER